MVTQFLRQGSILVSISILALLGCEKSEFARQSFGLTQGEGEVVEQDDVVDVEDPVEEVEEYEIEIAADVPTLWPPNHKMVKVSLSSDNAEAACKIISVESDEAGIEEDYKILDDMSLELRSERDGNGDGRIYKVNVECAIGDSVVSKVVEVTCVHDQGK
jgi:hypothetical protein